MLTCKGTVQEGKRTMMTTAFSQIAVIRSCLTKQNVVNLTKPDKIPTDLLDYRLMGAVERPIR
jgi:hypothetical protein